MRHLVATAIVALIVSALTVTTITALAQEPGTVTPAVSGNADRVDGRHAVGAGASRSARAGKLVATDASGYLPANIVKNLVTKVTLSQATNSVAAEGGVGATGYIDVSCPTGAKVVGGGFAQSSFALVFTDSGPSGATGWYAFWMKVEADGAGAPNASVYAVCMKVQPAAALVVAGKAVRAASHKR